MPEYSLYWQEGRHFRADPEPFVFKVPDDIAALAIAARAIGTSLTRNGKLKKRHFYRAGAKELRRKDGTRIFPPPKKHRKAKKICGKRRKKSRRE